MKKVLMTLCFVALSVVFIHGYAVAAVSGTCANCHTMHSSQGGTQDTDWDIDATDDERGNLLANTCEGCHTTSGTDPLHDTDGIPYVIVGGPTYLAGGYFTTGGGSHDDNSHTLGSAEVPAGYSGSSYDGSSSATGLTCAGSSGCHGDQSVADAYASVNGGHHGTDTTIDGTTVPKSYRFLKGVKGTEAADFEEVLNNAGTDGANHNIYYAGTNGVSTLCASCHSDFHGLANTAVDGVAGPWDRHPTDVAIPTDWDIYANFGTVYAGIEARYKETPLGFTDGAESAATAQVICLSCHRAHGSDQPDNLRWDYTTMDAGGGGTTGCLACHSDQQ